MTSGDAGRHTMGAVAYRDDAHRTFLGIFRHVLWTVVSPKGHARKDPFSRLDKDIAPMGLIDRLRGRHRTAPTLSIPEPWPGSDADMTDIEARIDIVAGRALLPAGSRVPVEAEIVQLRLHALVHVAPGNWSTLFRPLVAST